MSTRCANPEPAKRPISARRYGAARTGRRSPTAQRRGCFIFRQTRICAAPRSAKVAYTPGERFVGATTTLYIAPGADHIGELQAWNLDTGKKVWSHPFANSQLWGPVLATGGGLVFMGGTNDRYFRAFDASTGKVLWQIPHRLGGDRRAGVVRVDGKQYIAVQSGWGVDSARMQARLNLARPYQFPDVPQGGAIWVFALP